MSAATAPAAPPGGGSSTESLLSPADLAHFVDVVDKRIGVQLVGKEYLIESRLQAVAVQNEVGSVASVLSAIRRGDRRLESAAIEAMTTNETSFFRDRHPFDALAEQVLPEIADANGGRLTIWNGACSSGQESYTLAMTIAEHLPLVAKPGRTRIVSTDVSDEMVARTKAGTFSRFEVNRGLPTDLAMKYFTQSGRQWVAKPELSSLIEARVVNLLGTWTGVPRADLVLLRNVLIYFTVPVRQEIIRRIRTDVLKPGGYLLLGASETLTGIDDGFESRRIGSSTFHTPRGSS